MIFALNYTTISMVATLSVFVANPMSFARTINFTAACLPPTSTRISIPGQHHDTRSKYKSIVSCQIPLWPNDVTDITMALFDSTINVCIHPQPTVSIVSQFIVTPLEPLLGIPYNKCTYA